MGSAILRRDIIAKAIYEAPGFSKPWESLSAERQAGWLQDADRVIAALQSTYEATCTYPDCSCTDPDIPCEPGPLAIQRPGQPNPCECDYVHCKWPLCNAPWREPTK